MIIEEHDLLENTHNYRRDTQISFSPDDEKESKIEMYNWGKNEIEFDK
jgi:hypothetical protein